MKNLMDITLGEFFSTVGGTKSEREAYLAMYHSENERMVLINALITRREDLGLTKKDVAESTGMSQRMITSLETYGVPPKLDDFNRYLLALDISLLRLVQNEIVKNNQKLLTND